MAEKNVGITVRKLLIVVVAMFGFGFAMVPLYNVFCDITGLNGKTADEVAEEYKDDVDQNRIIRVSFIANRNQEMPWEFRPTQAVIDVHPGEIVNTTYWAKNTTSHDMVSQSVPSVVPSVAAQYFHKIQCFCFNNQPLAAGEGEEMALQFYVDPKLPKSIKSITLAYTIFDITETVNGGQKQAHAG